MTITEAAAWRDLGAARRETVRVEAADRSAAAARERFAQRVADGQTEIAVQPPASTQRLLDIRV